MKFDRSNSVCELQCR